MGLLAFGLLTKRQANDRAVPYICVASPLLCYVIAWGVGALTGYRFGYELLMLNGLLTFLGLLLSAYGQRHHETGTTDVGGVAHNVATAALR